MDQKPTLLVVDDTPHNLDIMVNLLSERYRVKVAINGEKALKIAQGEAPPDLILLDIMMPGMDGYEVIGHLKSNEKTRAIPVIFVTAMHEVGDEEKGLGLGAVDYITKPVSPPIVMARVEAHLKLADQRRALEEEVKDRTKELHLKNVRLEEELQARRILEKKTEFQLGVQRCAARMAQLQMKSTGLEEAGKEILKGLGLALDLERSALYHWDDDAWELLGDLPGGEAPKLSDEELNGDVELTQGERLNALDDEGELVIWTKSDFKGEDPDREEAMAYLMNEAKLLIRSAQMRESIASFDLS